jgi:hypothetical protein
MAAARTSRPEGELPTGGNSHTGGESATGGEAPSGGEQHPGYEAPTGGESLTGGNRRIYPARTAEDGHSLGEQALYSALWNAAEPQPDGSRIICIGWRGMSQIARLDPKNAKLNTRSLIEKLTLECIGREDSETRTGRTYRVFSPGAIVTRRREAGLEWVVRNRGVRFVPRPPGR